MAQHQAVMHIHCMLYIHVDKHTLVFLQVLGFGSSCKDAILCIHLHATSVRVPGMVASWSWAETGGSTNTLSPPLFRSLLRIRSMLQLYSFLFLYKFLSWWGVRAMLRRGSQLTWVKCFYPTPLLTPPACPPACGCLFRPLGHNAVETWCWIGSYTEYQSWADLHVQRLRVLTARASWWNDSISAICLCLSNCL